MPSLTRTNQRPRSVSTAKFELIVPAAIASQRPRAPSANAAQIASSSGSPRAVNTPTAGPYHGTSRPPRGASGTRRASASCTAIHASGFRLPSRGHRIPPRRLHARRTPRYVRRVDAAARAQLIERHLGIARKAAQLVYPRVRQHVELDELIALGNAGLAEAAQRYDPARGASFATFAWYRVHGAIIDGVRRAAHVPRRTWAQLVALRAAGEYLEQRGEREAGAIARGAAPATGAGALAEVQRAMSAIRTMYVTSLEALREAGHDVPADQPPPGARLERRQLAQRLRAAIDALPDKERALVTKHYWEGKNLLETGAELGISKSWASRLHAQAVDRLRAVFGPDG